MYRAILVPLDGSTFGEHALPLALSIARRAGGSIELAHVHAPLTPVYLEGAAYLDADFEERLKLDRQAYLDGMAKRIREVSPEVEVSTVLLEGPVAETLASHAREKERDLMVMTTHGRGAFARFWLGSVTDEVLRHATMPLILVHPRDEPPNLASDPAPRHILVALDGTPHAEELVSPAAEVAALMSAQVTLFRAVNPIIPVTSPADALGMGEAVRSMMDRLDSMQAELQKEAASYLEKVAGRLRERGVSVDILVGVEEQPAHAILEAARQRDCDLIAVETRGRHGFSRLLLGSVTDKVIRGATVPILVDRPAQE